MKHSNTIETINEFAEYDKSLKINVINRTLVIFLSVVVLIVSAYLLTPKVTDLNNVSFTTTKVIASAPIEKKSHAEVLTEIIVPVKKEINKVVVKKDNKLNEFLNKITINGIISNGDKSRVSINGKVFKIGNVINNEYGIRLIEILPQINTLVLEEKNGKKHQLRY